MFRRLLREPLIQFLLVGLALFGGWRLVAPAQAGRDASNRIVITESDLEQMTTAWMAQGMPRPTPQQLQVLELYAQALAQYRQRGFAECIALLDKALTLMPDDGPSQHLKKKCEQFLVEPPAPSWDGVSNLEK